MKRDLSAYIINLAGEVVEGARGAFTNAFEISIGNNHKSMIACEIGPLSNPHAGNTFDSSSKL